MTPRDLARRLAAIIALPAMTPVLASCLYPECVPDHVFTETITGTILDRHLDAPSRARVTAGKHEAMRALFAALVEPDATLRRLAGLPSADEAAQILEAMTAQLWSAPLAA